MWETFTAQPIWMVFAAVVILAVVIILQFRKIEFTTKMIVTVAMAIALSVILNNIKLYEMPQGGTVTLASMVPIFLVAFAYGPRVGLLAGFLFGTMNALLGGYVIHWAQLLLDYPLAFMFLGLAGFFPKHMNLGVILAALARFLSHVLSGLIFFSQGLSPAAALGVSLSYNGTFLAADLIIALIVLNLIPINRILKTMNPAAAEVQR